MREKLRDNKGLFNQNFNNGKANGRPFLGMNPDLQTNSIVFDSYFESGNLDCVIKVTENEYDLFMRVDSNTRGHLQW